MDLQYEWMPNLAQSQTNNSTLLLCSSVEALCSLSDLLIHSSSWSLSPVLGVEDIE